MKSIRDLVKLFTSELANLKKLFPQVTIGNVQCNGFQADEQEASFQTIVMFGEMHSRNKELQERTQAELAQALAGLRKRSQDWLNRMPASFRAKAERVNVLDIARNCGLEQDRVALKAYEEMKNLRVIGKINDLLLNRELTSKQKLEAASLLYHEGLQEVANLRTRFASYANGRMQQRVLLSTFAPRKRNRDSVAA